jgi:A-macroglobulin complement component/MG2 domain-containing protein/alpha-2-macroglobulin family protein
MARVRFSPVLFLMLAACPVVDPAIDREGSQGGRKLDAQRAEDEEKAPSAEVIQPPAEPERDPGADPRQPDAPSAAKLLERTRSYFEGHRTRRIYVQVDKPLYKPGETIWIKTWDLRARDLDANAQPQTGIHYALISPKGAVVLEKNVLEERGMATNDFEIPDSAQGGEYILRAGALDGSATEERPIIISTYEAPRLKKKLEFTKKAYGPGDEVTATIKVERPTGEPLASRELAGLVWLDGETLTPVTAMTNADGGALIRFTLPGRIDKGDGLLTVMIGDGGVTESVSKRVPILLKKLDLAFLPEGGQLVQGIPSRVYFEAKNPLGKPADVEGRIVDDRENVVAQFSTYHVGLGRLELMPSTKRTYFAEITRPAGITEKYPLPLAAESGCVLRTFDDFDSQEAAIRVALRCSEAKDVSVVAVIREDVIDVASVHVPADRPAIVHLASKDEKLGAEQGIARVTVFDDRENPLAERLIYRGRRSGLHVAITPDKKTYAPREQVALTVKTSDRKGRPIAAELALSVVDDTVVSFADDKTGHLLSRTFLEPEIPEKIEEPNFFFDLTKAKSAFAMDLLMGTRGYRKFEWQIILAPPPPPVPATTAESKPSDPAPKAGLREREFRAARPPMARPPAEKAKGTPPRNDAPKPVNKLRMAEKAPAAQPGPKEPQLEAAAPAKKQAPPPIAARRAAGGAAARAADDLGGDADWANVEQKRVAVMWAPVRVFPAPTYRGDETGPRSDFRETIHWAPRVITGKDGKAIVAFHLSDAVTSFRVFAEGVGGGLAGRAEQVIKSSLPFSMSVKLPLEVSANDRFLLPLTLSNEKDKPVKVSIHAAFGDLVDLETGFEPETMGAAILAGQTALETTLGAGERKSIFYPLTVKGTHGKSKIAITADADGLKDEFIRELNVVPVGFPQVLAASGALKDEYATTLDLGEAIEGSVEATIKLYPSPVATIVSGLDGMLREPSGCFEQTSSTNYPNIMVLSYLKANDVADPNLIERADQLIDRGYKRLVGFETKSKGYEWFGQAPAHEALTAYGLLEFADLRRVYGGVDDQMLARTAAWIKSRRNGQGGFQRDPKALDSFGGAKSEVTDAYIVYSLTEAGYGELEAEIAAQSKLAESTQDPYLLALAANTLLNVQARRSEGQTAAKRLAKLQTKDGAWRGLDHSITRSTGINLDIETTAFSLLALMKAGGQDDAVRRGVEWLNHNRGGFGQWGATQATVLALKAMTEYANRSRRMQSAGDAVLTINGQVAGKVSWEAGRRDALEFTDAAKYFVKGANRIELEHSGKGDLPFTIGVEFRTIKPATSPNVVVNLTTKLERSTLKMGENVRLTAVIKNKTASGQPMTIARIALPGGLTFQTWQLKELKDRGAIAFWETRAREVVVYFRDLKPSEEKEIPLDLVATVPGEYTGPASSAYLYYSDDAKVWTDGLKVTVGR